MRAVRRPLQGVQHRQSPRTHRHCRMDPTAQTSRQEQQAGPPPAAENCVGLPRSARRGDGRHSRAFGSPAALHRTAAFLFADGRQIAKHRAAGSRRRAAAAASASEGVGAAESEEEVAMTRYISRQLASILDCPSEGGGNQVSRKSRESIKWHGGWSSGDSDSDRGELRGRPWSLKR